MAKLKRTWLNVLKKLENAGQPLPQFKLPNGHGHCYSFWCATDATINEMQAFGALRVSEVLLTGLCLYEITDEGRALLEAHGA